MIECVILLVGFIALALASYPLFWLTCRLTAKRCPKCCSKYETELVGEWGDELWVCRRCGHAWHVSYK